MNSKDASPETPASASASPAGGGRELVLTRILRAPRRNVYRAWTEPALMKAWFVPKPWTVASAETDVRVGGSSCIVFRGPDGNEFPNRGVYLEVVPDERLVFTDAYIRAWEPSEKPFMTVTLTFADAPGGCTKYTALVRHWTVADRETHEKMGFHQGWGTCAEQLEAVAAKL
jgi:uncharacterized protein YndB with AHSA1/START domain